MERGDWRIIGSYALLGGCVAGVAALRLFDYINDYRLRRA